MAITPKGTKKAGYLSVNQPSSAIRSQPSHATIGTQKDNNYMADRLKRGWMLTHKRCKIYLIWIEINNDGQECILVFVTTFVNVRITSQMRFPCQTDFDILFQAWIWAIRNLCFLVNQVRNCDSHIYMQ